MSGYRGESTQSWRELLLDLKRRGLTRHPDLAIGDGALGNLHDIWQTETRASEEVAVNFFTEAHRAKYDKAVAKLTKGRDVLPTFYDFPAEHWKFIRTSKPNESNFATVRHRTSKTKSCLSRKTGLAGAFRLLMSAQLKWQHLMMSTECRMLFKGLLSRTKSNTFKVPPDDAATNLWP